MDANKIHTANNGDEDKSKQFLGVAMDSADNMFMVSSKLFNGFCICRTVGSGKNIQIHRFFIHRYAPIGISTFPRLRGIPGENVFTRQTENWKTLRNTLRVKVCATWNHLILHIISNYVIIASSTDY